jgi:putative ABC transport system ATP-binding protein
MNPHAAVAHAATDLAHAPAASPLRDASAPASGAASAVAASAVARRYGNGESAVDALRGVTLDVPAGQFLAVMGPSGSGKSTLMHLLAGLDRPTAGTVRVGGEDITAMSDKQLTKLRRRHIGFVFQQFNLLPTLTAEENITLPLQIAGRKPDKAWFDQVVGAVNLRDRLKHRPTELSGGQQQRVACARALITRPAVIFADEPTGNLDSRSSAEVLGFLRSSVTELGQTIVMVTHEPSAAAYADRVLFLADGRIVDEMRAPTADSVLDRMKGLEPGQETMYQPVGA